jgi:hypothetical protein
VTPRPHFCGHVALEPPSTDRNLYLRLSPCARSDNVSSIRKTGSGQCRIGARVKGLRTQVGRSRIRRDYESRRKSKFIPTEASAGVGIISK